MAIISYLSSFFNFKKILSNLTNISLGNIVIIMFLSLIAILIIPNYNQIKEKLGFETRTSLSVKLTNETNNKEKVIDANNSLNETIKQSEETKKHEDKAVLDLVTLEKDIKTNTRQIIAKKNKRIQDIKDDAKPIPQPIPTVLVKDETTDKPNQSDINEKTLAEIEQHEQEKAISLVQIESLWEAFCGFNNSPECQKGVS